MCCGKGFCCANSLTVKSPIMVCKTDKTVTLKETSVLKLPRIPLKNRYLGKLS